MTRIESDAVRAELGKPETSENTSMPRLLETKAAKKYALLFKPDNVVDRYVKAWQKAGVTLPVL